MTEARAGASVIRLYPNRPNCASAHGGRFLILGVKVDSSEQAEKGAEVVMRGWREVLFLISLSYFFALAGAAWTAWRSEFGYFFLVVYLITLLAFCVALAYLYRALKRATYFAFEASETIASASQELGALSERMETDRASLPTARESNDPFVEIAKIRAQLNSLQRDLLPVLRSPTKQILGKRGMNTETKGKLEKLLQERNQSIKNGIVTIAWSVGCDRAGIRPETASRHASKLQERWSDASYHPEITEFI